MRWSLLRRKSRTQYSLLSVWISILLPLTTMRCGWPCWTRFANLERKRRNFWMTHCDGFYVAVYETTTARLGRKRNTGPSRAAMPHPFGSSLSLLLLQIYHVSSMSRSRPREQKQREESLQALRKATNKSAAAEEAMRKHNTKLEAARKNPGRTSIQNDRVGGKKEGGVC